MEPEFQHTVVAVVSIANWFSQYRVLVQCSTSFEFRVIVLNWLPTKAEEPSISYNKLNVSGRMGVLEEKN